MEISLISGCIGFGAFYLLGFLFGMEMPLIAGCIGFGTCWLLGLIGAAELQKESARPANPPEQPAAIQAPSAVPVESEARQPGATPTPGASVDDLRIGIPESATAAARNTMERKHDRLCL